MTDKQKRAGLERLLRKCPDVLTPVGAAHWTHQSKNTIYELIKENALPAYNYCGGFLIAKEDLIEYMVAHTDDTDGRTFKSDLSPETEEDDD